MATTPEEYQKLAEEAVKESADIPDFAYTGEVDLGVTWATTFSQNRDSDLLEQSNYEAVKKDLEKRFPKDVSDERFSHWAVGWVDHLLVRMLDKKGKVTKAGIAALEWKDQLESYPVADEEDYSRREYEASLENIAFEGGISEDVSGDVYRWLSDHEPREVESQDGKGAYPSKESIDRALKALGLRELEEGEEPPPPPRYIDPPEQIRFWPETT